MHTLIYAFELKILILKEIATEHLHNYKKKIEFIHRLTSSYFIFFFFFATHDKDFNFCTGLLLLQVFTLQISQLT